MAVRERNQGIKLRHGITKNGASVVVSPDLDGVDLDERYGAALGLPVVVVHKERVSGDEVAVQAITGDVKGQLPLIVDDMISTRGTIEAAARALMAAGCEPCITVAATHGLLVGQAVSRLEQIPLRRLYVSNSVVMPSPGALPVQEVDLSVILAESIRGIYEGGHIIH